MMPRVCFFYDEDGREQYNTDRPAIPFNLMKYAGDWCEVERGPDCLAGNVANLCSAYSRKLGRRFKFKDLNNGVFLITVMREPIKKTLKRKPK